MVGIGTGVVYSQFGDAQAVNAAGDAGSATTWINGVNYAYRQVTITGTSDYIDVLATSYSFHPSPSFNGLQIVGVPEPQTWALVALGVSSLVFFRLRRKQRVA